MNNRFLCCFGMQLGPVRFLGVYRRIALWKWQRTIGRRQSSRNADASKYERKTAMEHVLLRPDTYIGGVGMREQQEVWVYDESTDRMKPTLMTYPPGLIKIFDEILVNAADNKARDPSMDRLDVLVDEKACSITITNNGKGLPVEIHPSEGIYVPTLVFGNLFTSSNYDDNEIKIVGGRNGYGAKLCNIFSKEFIVETVDARRRLKFRQRWRDNMKVAEEALVESSMEADYTKVTFSPDLRFFHLDHLTGDVIELMKRRVIDVSSTLPRGVECTFNGQPIATRGFDEFVRKFGAADALILHPNQRWHVAIARRRQDELELPATTSFVNNINTEKGGSHVDHVTDKIVAVLKKACGVAVRPAAIKSQLSVFVNALIENPSFESQTKETLTTKPKMFGSAFEVNSKKLLEWAKKVRLIEDIEQVAENQKAKRARKKTDVSGILKLEDAAFAGTPKRSKQCTLIVTEGDSAKALALAGLEILGREYYGVFPLKGKLVNVQNLDEQKARENEEVASLMAIVGLEFGHGVFAENEWPLRYGRLMILTDQDEDGSHIKGLVINFIHKFWPRLISVDGFVTAFRTPLLKARKGKEVVAFFSNRDYGKWAEETPHASKYAVKYYKGLGTSTSEEAREYFANLDHHIVRFKYAGVNDDEAVSLAFDRTKSEERKQLIRKLEESTDEATIDAQSMSYREFVENELMRFGIVDLRRSIPSLVDGLKPSQRKVVWTLLNMDESKEMKVSQLAGAVAHQQAYHHGEESLVRTIVRMGQSFAGASNLPLLEPIGQFGTRHEAGQDAASPRYIFTALSTTSRLIFPRQDDALLERRWEDGVQVEPKYLCPIIPLVLVNGAEGIGTGWSVKIANRKPMEVIDGVRALIDGQPGRMRLDELLPFYNEFEGTVRRQARRFVIDGRVRLTRHGKSGTQICIDELPIGMATSRYKEKLMEMVAQLNGQLTEHHTQKRVDFRVRLPATATHQLHKLTNHQLLRHFRLSSTLTENLVLFDADEQLREFDSIDAIAVEHFAQRRRLYEQRLLALRDDCLSRLRLVDNQIRFIDTVDELDMRRRNRDEIESQLRRLGFDDDPMKTGGFDYLLDMPISRQTADERARLCHRRDKRRQELAQLEETSWKSAWLQDLDSLEKSLC